MPSSKAHDRFRFTAQAPGPTIVRAEGAELIADDGRRILDAAGGAVVCNIGHGRAEVVEAVAEAMGKLDYVLPTWATPARLELADLLVDRWLPEGFNHIFLAGGGSEANDSAIRLARFHHLSIGQERRTKVIGRMPSYHGSTIATLAMGGHTARRSGYEPLMAEWPKVPWNDADALAGIIEAAGPDTVAAFVAEPVIGASGGALVANADYWAQVSEVCRHYGVLTIADEVMTGFGRTGSRWGFEQDPWTPDILVSGKGLGGGYVPISLVSAADHVIDPITEAGRTVMFFTYSGHDSTCAGASAVLRIIEREGLVERSALMGVRLRAALEAELSGHPNVVEIRGRGLMMGVELAGPTSVAVVMECLERGMWVYPSGSGGPTPESILLAPPLIVTDEQIDRIASTLAAAISAVAH